MTARAEGRWWQPMTKEQHDNLMAAMRNLELLKVDAAKASESLRLATEQLAAVIRETKPTAEEWRRCAM